jgi:hypothetical protein
MRYPERIDRGRWGEVDWNWVLIVLLDSFHFMGWYDMIWCRVVHKDGEGRGRGGDYRQRRPALLLDHSTVLEEEHEQGFDSIQLD